MKQLFDISSNFSFYMLLGFLLLIPFSIAACYILFTLLLIVWFVSYLNRKQLPDPPQSFFPMPGFYKFFLFYILATLLSTLFSLDRLHSLKDNKEVFVYLLIPLFLLVLHSKKRLEYSLAAVLTAAAASSLLGIVQALIQGVSLDHRLQGATSHWMTYSGLLMFPFIFFFVYLFYEKDKKKKWTIGVSLIPILVAIFLSLTRSMWVGIFVSLAVFIIYYKPKVLYIAIPAAIILVLAMPGSVKTRVTSIFDPNNPTNKDRVYMIRAAVNIFKEYPFTGVGPNIIEKVYDTYKPAGAEHTNTHLHNNFLHVLAERGLIGLLALILAFGSVLFLLIKKIKNSAAEEKAVSTAVLFVFIGFLVAGLFEYNFGDSEVKFQLFYFLCLAFLPFLTSSPDADTDADSAPPKENPHDQVEKS
jgi:O-antigen ligase